MPLQRRRQILIPWLTTVSVITIDDRMLNTPPLAQAEESAYIAPATPALVMIDRHATILRWQVSMY